MVDDRAEFEKTKRRYAEDMAADEGLPESVRKLSKAIQELRVVARSGEGRDPPPAFAASLVELESLLLMLCDGPWRAERPPRAGV